MNQEVQVPRSGDGRRRGRQTAPEAGLGCGASCLSSLDPRHLIQGSWVRELGPQARKERSRGWWGGEGDRLRVQGCPAGRACLAHSQALRGQSGHHPRDPGSRTPPPLPRFPQRAGPRRQPWSESLPQCPLYKIRACRSLRLTKISPTPRAAAAVAARSGPAPPRPRPPRRTPLGQHGWCRLCHVKGRGRGVREEGGGV